MTDEEWENIAEVGFRTYTKTLFGVGEDQVNKVFLSFDELKARHPQAAKAWVDATKEITAHVCAGIAT